MPKSNNPANKRPILLSPAILWYVLDTEGKNRSMINPQPPSKVQNVPKINNIALISLFRLRLYGSS